MQARTRVHHRRLRRRCGPPHASRCRHPVAAATRGRRGAGGYLSPCTACPRQPALALRTGNAGVDHSGDDLERIVAGMGENGQRAGVLAMRPPLGTYPMLTWINAGPRAEAYAHVLYAHLRTLDKVGCARILVQEVPSDERWDAAYDRLHRAAASATELADGGDTVA